jgi:hypothetical protein
MPVHASGKPLKDSQSREADVIRSHPGFRECVPMGMARWVCHPECRLTKAGPGLMCGRRNSEEENCCNEPTFAGGLEH